MKFEVGANEAEQRIDKFLRKWLKDVPLGAIFKAIRKGDIRVNGKKIKQNYILNLGDQIEAKYIVSEKKNTVREFIEVDFSAMKICYEDENILVVEKWPGVLVHANKKEGEATLTDYVLSYLVETGKFDPEEETTYTPASCNRLDRNTSGLVIFGKNYPSQKAINEMIRERSIKKNYYSLVKGRMKSNLYKAYLLKDEVNNLSQISKDNREGYKPIAMDLEVIDSVGLFTFVDIELITGRSHQLRAHLASLGNPIIGDKKYGNKELNNYFENKFGLQFQFLYAYKLEFKNCPEHLAYLENKVITEALPPIFKKTKRDALRI
ncbi:pseudouridine synthase [Clostridium grantii]|uniref:RNA pseudouridylate synthase n=1 Tax=Clostridium grantii DSM 8605 TaxID=1121316 RepID=A0A1M5RGX2_9CLOT|nr:RluA family pseudouridine synthase [Clostridium grantii]SHH25438.1 23S rRNA pseudouridine955/2504/2580 synthase [Clostridium grantii DSM 8605]